MKRTTVITATSLFLLAVLLAAGISEAQVRSSAPVRAVERASAFDDVIARAGESEVVVENRLSVSVRVFIGGRAAGSVRARGTERFVVADGNHIISVQSSDRSGGTSRDLRFNALSQRVYFRATSPNPTTVSLTREDVYEIAVGGGRRGGGVASAVPVETTPAPAAVAATPAPVSVPTPASAPIASGGGIGFGSGFGSSFGGASATVPAANAQRGGIEYVPANSTLDLSHRPNSPDTTNMDLLRGDEAPTGGRNRASILRVVMQNMAALRHAYNERLREKPGLSGTITVKFSIDEFGKVLHAQVEESTVNDSALENTVVTRVRSWVFDRIDRPGDVTEFTHPFVFSQ
jgi:TonB family protein